MPESEGGGDRYYYSWTCAVAAAATLCDNKWRLPLKEDFDALVKYVKDTYKDDPLYIKSGTMTYQEGGRILGEHPDFAWGYGGLVSGSSLTGIGTSGDYWSSADVGTLAPRLGFYSNGGLNMDAANKCGGFQVRCVKSN
jgi:uncharacterized protein (TIGR02145 family)